MQTEIKLFLKHCIPVLQDLQSLQSVGTDVPARLVVDRVRLYIAEVMALITANRDHVLDVQTQYTDGLEDFVKSVFVRGVEDAIAARDAWHHDKVASFLAALCCLSSPGRRHAMIDPPEMILQ